MSLNTNVFSYLQQIVGRNPKLLAKVSAVYQDRVIAETPNGSPLEFFGDFSSNPANLQPDMWFIYQGQNIVDTMPSVTSVITITV